MMTHNNQNGTETQAFLTTDVKILSQIKGCLLGIDYGMVRIGLALSDSDRQIVRPFKIIHKLKELDDIVPAKCVRAFVVGLPLQTDGKEGNIAKQVRLFCNRLIEKYHLPVLLIDERYTSKYATEYMHGHGVRQKRQNEMIDAVAASRILQKALNELNNI